MLGGSARLRLLRSTRGLSVGGAAGHLPAGGNTASWPDANPRGRIFLKVGASDSCRAHLNEAPDEPHRRLAAAGLLADDMVFNDPFVTLNRADLWRDYQTQLRAAGEELACTAPVHAGMPDQLARKEHHMGCFPRLSCGLCPVPPAYHLPPRSIGAFTTSVQGAGRSYRTPGWRCLMTGVFPDRSTAKLKGNSVCTVSICTAHRHPQHSHMLPSDVDSLFPLQASRVDSVQRCSPQCPHPTVVSRLQDAQPAA
jgi:hypothetical protein